MNPADGKDHSNQSVHGHTLIPIHERQTKQLPFQTKLISGAVAGIVGTSIIFPLDFVKTRIQNNPNTSVSALVRNTYQHHGIRGFYRGLLPNLVGVTPEKAIKLAVNDAMREYFAHKEGHSDSHHITAVHGMISGATAGFCQVIATNPMEMVKIQLQMGSSSAVLKSTGAAPSTSGPTMLETVKVLGLKGMYRGTAATLCRDVPFSILFFQSSAYFRTVITEYQKGSPTANPSFEAVFLGGITAGSIASTLVTPMDVVKTRLQAGLGKFNRDMKLLDAYKTIYREEGIRAFFRGSLARCFIVSPLFGITLLVYEFQKSLL